jgi:hypothetical protein
MPCGSAGSGLSEADVRRIRAVLDMGLPVIAEVEYRGLTPAGELRHPVDQGMAGGEAIQMTLRVSLNSTVALTVNRISIGTRRLVYIIRVPKMREYPKGRSRIVYIGTTKTGFQRVAQSAAFRSDEILRLHGVDHFEVRFVTCTPRQHVKTWHKLERALLLSFKDRYGSLPHCNTQHKNSTWTSGDNLFTRKRLRRIIEELG